MPHVELPQAEFKVVMLGETFTGKTSLVLRFAEGYYRDSARNPTVGAFFITKRLTVSVPVKDGEEPQPITAKLAIWDTAGQEQFKRLAPMYYKNAAAAIICYDVTSPKSYETLEYWMTELQQNVPPENNLVIAMCATKCDLASNPDMSQAEALAAATGSMFMTTSAKTNTNVTAVFQRLSERVLQIKMGVEVATTATATSSSAIFSGEAYGSGPLSSLSSSAAAAAAAAVGFVNGSRIHPAPPSSSADLASAYNNNPLNNDLTSTTQLNGNNNRHSINNNGQPLSKAAEAIEEHDGVVETGESGDSKESYYSRCDGIMCGDVVGTATESGSGCVIQ